MHQKGTVKNDAPRGEAKKGFNTHKLVTVGDIIFVNRFLNNIRDQKHFDMGAKLLLKRF